MPLTTRARPEARARGARSPPAAGARAVPAAWAGRARAELSALREGGGGALPPRIFAPLRAGGQAGPIRPCPGHPARHPPCSRAARRGEPQRGASQGGGALTAAVSSTERRVTCRRRAATTRRLRGEPSRAPGLCVRCERRALAGPALLLRRSQPPSCPRQLPRGAGALTCRRGQRAAAPRPLHPLHVNFEPR